MLASYPSASTNYDEMLDSSREPRSHWRAFVEGLSKEAPLAMQHRTEVVRRKVRENGVTYNVYNGSEGSQRPWDLNVLPLILPHDEWERIEAAVIQRATLLNRILIDVYGKQQTLAEGLLPAALIHGHAGFLRPCHDISHLDGVALHLYAVDLARSPDGRWWVVGDRTQAPSGAGYSLENRFVIARAFPELFRELNVRYLAGFFSTMRDSLSRWGRLCANSGKQPLNEQQSPLIVLMTAGPYNETYHEQSFLSRYLGVPLVQGSDLTVRNGIVWLKALSGLQRVHVIMRRVDDDFCDPLELRTDSALGVAGLTDVARRGNVIIANSLGSNLLESGALLGFLPNLSERLLGETLQMPSVGTWWCGEPAALEQVILKLDDLIVKPSFPQLRQYPVFGRDLKGAARAAFIAKMRANPQAFVGQELVQFSHAPIWRPQPASPLTASAMGLRVYACATPNGYVVMPGGLTRVATGPDDRVLAMQRGGGSKDTWVLASPSAAPFSLPPKASSSKVLVRDDTHLSSRVAENLYWFGRYCERCDNTSRLMRTTLDLLCNTPLEFRRGEWPTIQALCLWFRLITLPSAKKAGESKTEARRVQDQGDPPAQGQSQSQSQSQGQQIAESSVSASPFAVFSDAEVESAILLAMVSPEVPGLATQLQNLYRIASQLRERLSVDNWRIINQMTQRFGAERQPPPISEAVTTLDEAINGLMNLAGFALDGMTRDNGWRFLSIGRRIERLQFLCTLLQHGLTMNVAGNLDWLLEVSDSIVTYRARYMSRPEWTAVLDLLLLDESNPRSVVYQLEGVLNYLIKLARTYGDCGAEMLAPLFAELTALDTASALRADNVQLVDLLGRINSAIALVSELIGSRFFSYTGGGEQVNRI